MIARIRRRRAARLLLDALFDEFGHDGEPKSDDFMAIEAWLWRQLDEPTLAALITDARTVLRAPPSSMP